MCFHCLSFFLTSHFISHRLSLQIQEAFDDGESNWMMAIRDMSADLEAGLKSAAVRHLGLKLKLPAYVFCMSWCSDFEFRGT